MVEQMLLQDFICFTINMAKEWWRWSWGVTATTTVELSRKKIKVMKYIINDDSTWRIFGSEIIKKNWTIKDDLRILTGIIITQCLSIRND